MSATSRNALETLPIKVFFRDGSAATIKLGAVATFAELHRAVVMKVRGTKGQKVLKDSDPLLRYFALYTVMTESYIERIVNPNDNVWTVRDTFKLPTDHIEFARLVHRTQTATPPTPLHSVPTPSSSRVYKDASHSDDEAAPKSRYAIGIQNVHMSNKRSSSPLNSQGNSSSDKIGKRARQDSADGITKSRSDKGSAGSLSARVGGNEEGESSEDQFQSPPTSPRTKSSGAVSPRYSPMRQRRGSVGNASSMASLINQGANGLSSANSSSSSLTPALPLIPARVDSTLLWADFLEATHLVATCPLYKPKEVQDVISLAALHFYIFSLQSPPPESSSRKEKAKSSGGGKESGDKGSQHSVHIEDAPGLSKTYRKSLHKTLGAFYPPRLMALAQRSAQVLEESVWSCYVESVNAKLTVEDAMTEYSRQFSSWRFSEVRLFLDVKRDLSALLATPKSCILALNEDGMAVLKKDKDHDVVASYLYSNIATWAVVGNVISIDYYPEDSTASGPSGAMLADVGSSGLGSSGSLQVPGSQQTPNSPSSSASSSSAQPALSARISAFTGVTHSVTFITPQAETISAIMQFYLDRLVNQIFDRVDSLRYDPSPRIFLLTDIGSNMADLHAQSAHRLAVDSLTPALNQLRAERNESNKDVLGTSSGASDSDRENSYSQQTHDGHSGGNLKRPSATSLQPATPGPQPSSGPSSPLLGRKRSPSLPRAALEARLELRNIDLSDDAFTSEDGPRRQASKTRTTRNTTGSTTPSSSRLSSSRQSDAESKGSESDRDRLASSLGVLTDGSEELTTSRPSSPFPPHDSSSSDPPLPSPN